MRLAAVQVWTQAIMQLVAAVGAGLLLGETWSQSIGIFLALYCIMPAAR